MTSQEFPDKNLNNKTIKMENNNDNLGSMQDAEKSNVTGNETASENTEAKTPISENNECEFLGISNKDFERVFFRLPEKKENNEKYISEICNCYSVNNGVVIREIQLEIMEFLSKKQIQNNEQIVSNGFTLITV